jgi:squamous cell carcinoma antigen recognized by T-cells 3
VFGRLVGDDHKIQEAGRLLLTPEPIVFGGRELQLIEDDLSASSQKSSGPMFVPRGAAGRPRAGIGSKKNTKAASRQASSGTVGSSTTIASSGKGQDDFRRMLNPST